MWPAREVQQALSANLQPRDRSHVTAAHPRPERNEPPASREAVLRLRSLSARLKVRGWALADLAGARRFTVKVRDVEPDILAPATQQCAAREPSAKKADENIAATGSK